MGPWWLTAGSSTRSGSDRTSASLCRTDADDLLDDECDAIVRTVMSPTPAASMPRPLSGSLADDGDRMLAGASGMSAVLLMSAVLFASDAAATALPASITSRDRRGDPDRDGRSSCRYVVDADMGPGVRAAVVADFGSVYVRYNPRVTTAGGWGCDATNACVVSSCSSPAGSA
ncbi:hypothetical protein BC831DRAFT_472171 [Entophlyctis helioformis]|nr:hypothetical protein BC831DRAFT_472171 [Entophlyctis helioformis]